VSRLFPGRNCRSVLYVDDDPDICSLVQNALCRAGMDVRTACSGEMAIDLAFERRPELIVLDAVMPGLDGPATYRRIRESPLIGDTPTIFATGPTMPADVAYFTGLGAIGVLAKPFDPRRIGADLNALWKRAQRACTALAPAGGSGRQAGLAAADPLVERFLERTGGDLERLRCLVKCVGPDGRNARTELEQIERIAHSICGAAEVFGFPAVSTVAAALEQLAGSLLRDAGPGAESAEPAAPRLARLTGQLAHALAKGLRRADQRQVHSPTTGPATSFHSSDSQRKV